ncbi:MAG: putative rane protein [Chloroflexota bacterium]|jgi:drug/metabolite transporter (DMT)-like permease
MNQQQTARRGLVWGFIGVLIFSVSLPMTRVAVAEMSPVFVAMARGSIAAGLSMIALVVTRSPWLSWAQYGRVAITALGVTIGFPLFSSLAMQQVPAGHGAIVNGLLPLATVALGAVVVRYTVRWQFWVAALVGSATAVAVVTWQSGTGLVQGDGAMVLAVLIAAVGYVSGGQLSKEIGGWRTICWANVVSIPVLLIPTAMTLPEQAVSLEAWLALGYLGVFSMFLGFFAWYHGLALGGIPRVSQIQLVQPFLTMLWAWPIDGEVPSVSLLAAATVVVGCIWVARRYAGS